MSLPLNNRNYEQLVSLQPGVSYGGGDQLYIGLSNPSGQTNVVSFSINGQRTSQNFWTVDGADNVDGGTNLTLLIYPSVDAIAEFKTCATPIPPSSARAPAARSTWSPSRAQMTSTAMRMSFFATTISRQIRF